MVNSDQDDHASPYNGAVIYVATISVLLTFSVLANILVIYVISASKTMRNTTNVFICNLAIADILIAGFVVPQNIHHAMHTSNFVEGEFGCKSTTFLPVLCTANSVYNMVAAAYDKHRAIVSFSKASLTLTKAYTITLAIWVLAVAVASPTLAEYGLVTYASLEHEEELDNLTTQYMETMEDDHDDHDVQCTNTEQTITFTIINSTMILVLVFFIPFVSITVFYGHIGLFIWRKGFRGRKSIKVSPEQTAPRSSLVSRSVVRVVIMLITSVVLFAILRTPYFIIKSFKKITGRDGSENALSTGTILLNVFLTLGTAYNIIVYSIFNHNFRKELVKVATRRCRKNQRDQSTNIQSISHISQSRYNATTGESLHQR